MLLNKFVEERLLRAMAFASGVTRGILACRQHADSTPTVGVLKRYTVGQSGRVWNV
jgi:hypothetical protein